MAFDRPDRVKNAPKSTLVDAVRDIKIASAERGDIVVDMKEADRARLELLAQELKPVFDEVPLSDERFDFAISSGLQPRLWIDATAHVLMGKDRRQYRFVRDSRLGRLTLAEGTEIEPIVQAVTKYIAERIYERELAFAGDDISYREQAGDDETPQTDEVEADESAAIAAIAAGDVPEEKGSDVEEVSMAAKDRASKTSASKIGLLLIALFVVGGTLLLAFRDTIFGTIS
jgi:hypothetical protein